MAPQLSVLLALCSALALLLAAPSAGNDSNLLLTGDVLDTDTGLTTPTASFIIQDDCNLVLYNGQIGKGFVSNTHSAGVNCTLTLNEFGQLVILGSGGSRVWSSTSYGYGYGEKGKYAALLRPDGQVGVYGPMKWSTPSYPFAPSSSASSATHIGVIGDQKDALPMVQNVLFSGQILYDDAKLATRDYTFVMGSDCSLALTKAAVGNTWVSGTKGKGNNCFARVGHHGDLAVVDDSYRTLWTNGVQGIEGEYVLVLQIDGQAAVYGPLTWSTAYYN